MATKAKRWPNNAEFARVESIALATKGLLSCRKIIEDGRADALTTARAAKALDSLHRIRSLLQSVGPRVEVDERSE